MKALLIVLVAVVGTAGAAPFADPTRPPNGSENTPASLNAAPGGPRLESVLIAPDRRVAVISGQQVSLGGKFGEGRVVRITETEVSIREGNTTQVLKLFPESQKRAKVQAEKKVAK